MEFLGTKGRWYLQEYTDAYTNIIRCDAGKGFETIYIASTLQSTNKETRYNAQIMAHAPQLLEMLQKIVLVTDTYKGDFNDFKERYNSEIKDLIKQATTINK